MSFLNMNGAATFIMFKWIFCILIYLPFVHCYASKELFSFSKSVASKFSRAALRVVPKQKTEEVHQTHFSPALGLANRELPKAPKPTEVSSQLKAVLLQPQKLQPVENPKTRKSIPPSPPLLEAPPPPPSLKPIQVVLKELPPAPLIPYLNVDKLSRSAQKLEKSKVILLKEDPQVLVPYQEPPAKNAEFCTKNLALHFGSKVDFDRLFSEYIVIDTEATGLGDSHEITELAAVKMRNMQPTGEKFHVYLNPDREVSSSAHKLTKLTWKELKRFPRFRDIAHKFLNYIGDLPLVFHNAHFDLKLLNKNLQGIATSKLEDQHVVIDTYLFAKSVNPKGKNGLAHLATRYDLKRPGNEDVHGALIDADLLCEVFRGLFRENGSRFPKEQNWKGMPKLSVGSLPSIRNTPGESFFRELGIRCELPDTFRYVYNLYNPKLHRNFPAILIPFRSTAHEETGVYIRYIINHPLKKSATLQSIDLASRAFYGDITPLPLLHIYGSKEAKTLVLGSLSACLLFRDQLDLTDASGHQYIIGTIGPNITIQAYLDPGFLEMLETSDTVDTIVILSENDPLSTEEHKKIYFELINKLCLPQFLPFSKYKDEHNQLLGWLVRVQSENWIVSSQDSLECKTILHLTSTKYRDRIIKIVISETQIQVPGEPPLLLNSSNILLSPPRKKLVLFPFRCKSDGHAPLTTLVKKNANHVYDRAKARLSVSQPKDLAFYDKILLAQKLYEKGLPITDETPAAKYFKKRGINSKLPESFKYMQKMFHPGQDESFPLTLVPLTDIEGRMVAIHRLFCDEDGNQLLKKSGYPSKLSLGKAAGASIEVYKLSQQGNAPDTLMISEGIENALVVREVLINIMNAKKQKEIKDFLPTLQSTSGLTLHAVVGVNGLIDAPIDNNIKTIVLLADNDGDNKDVKSTLIKTVAHYLSLGKKVKVALPCAFQKTKIDLNDVYLSHPLAMRDDAILGIVQSAVDITSVEQLGSEEEPLEQSLKTLIVKKTHAETKSPVRNISALEQQLMDLISDRVFIEREQQKSYRKLSRR